MGELIFKLLLVEFDRNTPQIKELRWVVRTSWPYCCENLLLVL